jgi:hypothetical protein
MPGGRDTGLQVLHYVSSAVTAKTLGIGAGVKLGDLPLGALLFTARAWCSQAWGGGRTLILSLGGQSPVDIATFNVAATGVVDTPITSLQAAIAADRDVFVRLNPGALPPNGAAILALFYLPRLG